MRHGENQRLTGGDPAASSEVLWFVREQFDNIGVVSAYIGEGLGQVMGRFGGSPGSCRSGTRSASCSVRTQLVVLKLNPRDLLVLAQEVTR
jgi:hypothetical protein